ncbi:MAG: hypothetical protein A4E19_13880 [Nitrospira sp. SG-bin1]|nr:MAG: hypothetical protein A4E19_13880 [Nitrospira sp. SG-bin1]
MVQSFSALTFLRRGGCRIIYFALPVTIIIDSPWMSRLGGAPLRPCLVNAACGAGQSIAGSSWRAETTWPAMSV